VLPPKSLISPTGAGATERQRAEAHYSAPTAKAFEFKAYKGQDVVDALRRLFDKKCAYCESRFEAVTPGDVEHYRPKGGVREDPTHGGYWWLAAEWENLLPSCVDCNRERYQHVASSEMTQRDLDAIAKILSGKKDAFPIAGHSRAKCATDDHDGEDPLLIDPTVRDPARHLSWNEFVDNSSGTSRELSVVVPKRIGGVDDPYAQQSIAIYGLNRRGLVEERTILLNSLKTDHVRISNYIDIALGSSGPTLKGLLSQIEEDLRQFVSKGADSNPYSQCARAFIDHANQTLMDRLRQLRLKVA
jgi:uncharacterized protein (TIGR02646 family)